MQVQMETNESVDNAVARLQRFIAAPENFVTGTASESAVKIMRTQRIANSLFRPEFNGTFTATPNGCTLNGDFRLSRRASGMMKAWFSAVAVLAIIAAGVGIQSGYPQWWQVPLGGVAVGLGGVLFLMFARFYYRKDKDWIFGQLEIQLTGA